MITESPFVSNETPEAPAKEEVTILSSSLKSYPAPIVAVSLESEVILYSKSAYALKIALFLASKYIVRKYFCNHLLTN